MKRRWSFLSLVDTVGRAVMRQMYISAKTETGWRGVDVKSYMKQALIYDLEHPSTDDAAASRIDDPGAPVDQPKV